MENKIISNEYLSELVRNFKTEIRLEGWPGCVTIGLICATALGIAQMKYSSGTNN